MTKLWYLATPYSLFPYGLDEAAKTAAMMVANLTQKGENVFSPIVHSHYIAVVAGINPLDHAYWMEVDKPFMEKCDGLIVGMIPTWTKSRGVAMEVAAFERMKKPILYFDPEVDQFVSDVLN